MKPLQLMVMGKLWWNSWWNEVKHTAWTMGSYPFLVGGEKTSWKMMEFVNGKDDFQYIMENKIHVPNHQPDI